MRRVMKWTGLFYVVLVVAFLAWYVTRGRHLGDLVTLVSAFTGLLALPAAVIAVWRPGRGGPAPSLPAEAADQLAQGVRRQWQAEAQVRRLNDPFPLSVEWEAAEGDLFESWEFLTELASDWPGHSPSATSLWADRPAGLAGKGGDIAHVLERIPTRRLVVLGEPGAGKTMLLIRLLLALLEHRPPGGPVPVLFPLASWDPARQDLYTWMADELSRDHPSLQGRASEPSSGDQPRALCEARLILPLLDGLDELPQTVRTRALQTINQTLPAGHPFVLSSRVDEYRSALDTPGGSTILLNGAAGIRLLPLRPPAAVAYLERAAGGSGSRAAARWRRVAAELGVDTALSQALSTPLILFLARTVYHPGVEDQLADVPHPDELLDESRFPTRQAIEEHLFTAFIPAAYRFHPHRPARWTVQEAQRFLTFLARHLEHTLDGTPSFAWWELPRAFPFGQHLAIGLAAALLGGLPASILLGLWYGPGPGLSAGINMGFLSAMAALVTVYPLVNRARGPKNPSMGIRWNKPSWRTPGLAYSYGVMFMLTWSLFGFFRGFLGGLIGALSFALLNGFRPVRPDLDKAVGPRTILARDRRTFWAYTCLGGFTGTFTAVLWYTLLLFPFGGGGGFGLGRVAVLAFVLALPVGLMLGLRRSVWMEFLLAQARLAVLGRVPWRFISFLADAHEWRGVLRQAGAVYQFRHIDIQRHLAATE
ncbi:NACHT domain-containing protein [Streptomyces sp. NPDC002250]|uniref:NACHT domain-containing protein n=1 Tax=Streptomyces sp. NPDC002250 TaxID=3364641 RepID=UPI0036A5D708